MAKKLLTTELKITVSHFTGTINIYKEDALNREVLVMQSQNPKLVLQKIRKYIKKAQKDAND